LEDARPLDELAHDLTANHVLNDYTFDASCVDSIIQRRHAARARQRRKPGSEGGRLVRNDFANQHVRSLGAAAKAALPHELRRFAGTVSF
jgi:hypothetical protein